MSARPVSLPVGSELIEEFEIRGLLGSGGFANTYLAQDLTLGRDVAIKEFFPADLAVRVDDSSHVSVKSKDHAPQFEWALGRFVREAKTLAKFRHPSVVRVFRVFKANDTAYIVLEFVRGSNMEAWLKGLGRLPTQAELDGLIPPLLEALDVVHNAGILHRDIKPANIYIREADQTPVLLDFGAAKNASGLAADAGTTAAIVSKGYSPNEAYASDSRLQGPWTDIYGLAATLYRALHGRAPPESTTRILEDDCKPLSENPDLAPHYRPEFLLAIDKGLAVMPKDRPQSASEWLPRLVPDHSTGLIAPPSNPLKPSTPTWSPASVPNTDASASDTDPETIYDRSLQGSSGAGSVAPAESGAPPAEASAPKQADSGASIPPPISLNPSVAVNPLIRKVEISEVSSADTDPPTEARVRGPADRPVHETPMMLAGLFLIVGALGILLSQFFSGDRDGGLQPTVREVASATKVQEEEKRIQAQRLAEQQAILAERAAAEKRSREAEQRRAEAEQERLAAEAEVKRKADEEQKRVAAAAAEAKRKADEDERKRLAAEADAKRKAEEKRKAEVERKRLAAEEAERKRVAAEKERQRIAAEAEAKRKAEEQRKAEAERKRLAAEAEAKRKADAEQKRIEAIAERRRKQQAEARRLAAEAVKRRTDQERERIAAANARREAEAAAQRRATAGLRRQAELAEARRLAADAARREAERQAKQAEKEAQERVKLAALTPATGDWDRTPYVSRVQTALKTRSCYSGPVNGDIGVTATALNSTANARGTDARRIDLAKASVSDYENWLSWFDTLGSWSCGSKASPSDSAKQYAPVTRSKPKKRVKKKVTPRKKKATTKKKKSTKRRASKSRTPQRGGNSLLRGGR